LPAGTDLRVGFFAVLPNGIQVTGDSSSLSPIS
jgi:hypothetical protein